VSFKLFLRDPGVWRLVKEAEEQLKFFLAGAFCDDGHEVDELIVVNRRVQSRAVFDHVEKLIR
jgi:hypothetical protein